MIRIYSDIIIYWEINGADGATLYKGTREEAEREFELSFEPHGYKLIAIEHIKG